MTKLNTRIKFHAEVGFLITNDYLAGDKIVDAVLDPVNGRITVRSIGKETSNILVEDFPGKSLKQLKPLTKSLLVKAGVVFYDETRLTRKNGEINE